MTLFAIVDPGMSMLHGHHRAFNLRVAGALLARGHEVEVWANRAYPADPLFDQLSGVRLRRHFSYQPYYDSVSPQHDFGLNGYYAPLTQRFASELAACAGTGPMLFSSVFPYQLGALALNNAFHGRLLMALGHHHGQAYINHPHPHWQQAFADCAATRVPLAFHVVEPALQKLFAADAQGNMRIHLAPYPLEEATPPGPPPPVPVIGFLGGLRP
jgi:hypothetical protein